MRRARRRRRHPLADQGEPDSLRAARLRSSRRSARTAFAEALLTLRAQASHGGAGILWRRLDRPGHESALLSCRTDGGSSPREPAGAATLADAEAQSAVRAGEGEGRAEDGWFLQGRAAFVHGVRGCGLAYEVVCDAEWRTRSVEVTGWVDGEPVRFEARVAASGEWTVGGRPAPSLAGCIDVDLNFSPATNLLPIRRMSIAIGQERKVLAAWVRFPDFTVEPLDQVYRRLAERSYRYVSGGGAFEAQLEVDANGFVTRYPGFFEVESTR